MRRVRVIVAGSVHGVWFRTSCADLARGLGVSGWVRNAPDGTVEAVFEGAHDAVERMIGWCHHGPPLAAVASVEVIDEAPSGMSGFSITR